MKNIKSQVLYVTILIVFLCSVVWLALLFGAYVADDLTSSAADEQSIPPVRTY